MNKSLLDRSFVDKGHSSLSDIVEIALEKNDRTIASMKMRAVYYGHMMNELIPVIVIDDTPIKRHGVCDFIEETPRLQLRGQAENGTDTIRLVEEMSSQAQNPALTGW